MRVLIALIVLLALTFVGFGSYFTFQKRRQAEFARRQNAAAGNPYLMGRGAAAARNGERRRLATDEGGTSPRPRHRDLTPLGQAIGAAFRGTGYEFQGVTITEPPPITWFAAAKKPEVERRLAAIRSTITMSGDHEFAVFLSETASEADSSWLANAAGGEFDDGSAAAVSVADILCLVVSRSKTPGEKPLATHATVIGYAQKFGAVIRSELAKIK